jgi:hypothetical protein
LYPLHNLSAPIDALPVEVLSGIFQQVMDPDTDPIFATAELDPQFDTYSACISQALALSAVSTHFRHVAFYTPDLWMRIPMDVTEGKIDRVLSLLQHCIVLAPHVKISIRDGALDEEAAFSVIEALLTPEVTHKVKALELIYYTQVYLWLKKLQASSFPILDCLIISTRPYGMIMGSCYFDLGALNSVTKLCINAPHLQLPIVIPPSVQVLSLYDVRKKVQISILYQCPNLVRCLLWYGDSHPDDSIQFANPLTLEYLQRLRCETGGLHTISSVQNLRLPSLQHLDLCCHEDQDPSPIHEEFNSIKLLCSNVSTTLTTLRILLNSTEFEYQHFRQLARISLPNLWKLDIRAKFDVGSPHNILQALTPQDDECSDSEPSNLPSLEWLTVGSNHRLKPRFLLDLLAKWNLVGKTSRFRFETKNFGPVYPPALEDWSPELREELRLIVGNRRVKVRWNAHRL